MGLSGSLAASLAASKEKTQKHNKIIMLARAYLWHKVDFARTFRHIAQKLVYETFYLGAYKIAKFEITHALTRHAYTDFAARDSVFWHKRSGRRSGRLFLRCTKVVFCSKRRTPVEKAGIARSFGQMVGGITK